MRFRSQKSLAAPSFSGMLRSNMSIFEPHIQDLNAPPKNKGGSKLKDTELNQLASDANRYIKWPMADDLATDPINRLLMANRPTGQYKNVYPMGGGTRSNNWIVKLPLCGKSFRILISPFRIRCARYADAATLYFWKYRKTDRQPGDTDFNTSLAVATELMNLPACITQLRNLEEYLIRAGEIQTPTQAATEAKVKTFTRDLQVARKYLERARRYTRLLSDRYVLDATKASAVEMVIANITAALEIFSATLQAGEADVVAQIRIDAAAANLSPVKSEFDILCEQAAERARLAREEFNTTKI